MTRFTCLPSPGHADLGKQAGGKVWDAEAGEEVQTLLANGTIKTTHKGAVIAVFDNNGIFETSDKNVIARLKQMRFRVVFETKEESAKPKPEA